MPIYDCYCPECDNIKEDIILKINEECPKCSKCKTQMKRICNCTSFKLIYNNKTDMCDWNGNRSQYWDEYNKQKAQGKNVRISELDGD